MFYSFDSRFSKKTGMITNFRTFFNSYVVLSKPINLSALLIQDENKTEILIFSWPTFFWEMKETMSKTFI